MTDKRLEDHFKRIDAPPHRPEAEEAAIQLAREAFRAQQRAQEDFGKGNASMRRPKDIAGENLPKPFGEQIMQKWKKLTLAGGTAMATVLVAVIALNTMQYESDGNRPDSPAADTPTRAGDQGNLARPGNQTVNAEQPPVGQTLPEPKTRGEAVPPAPSQDGSVLADDRSRGFDNLSPSVSKLPQSSELGQAGMQAQTETVDEAESQPGASPPVDPLTLMEPPPGFPSSGVITRSRPVESDRLQSPYYKDEGRDRFAEIKTNSIKETKAEPVSTFSIDVDKASYAFVRRMLNAGQMPPADAVRVEEMINYFSYDYPLPEAGGHPFEPAVAVFPTPWNPETKLLHIGIKGYDIPADKRPQANLVFLMDVSGSMNSPDKLPLLKNAFRLSLDALHPDDTVGMVVYAGAAGVVLEPTPVKEKHKILAALDKLEAGGSTAGAAGIEEAYQLAEAHFVKEGVNRVILATDGDFNVGISDTDALKNLIEKKRKTGISLSVLGFGEGNYNDALMQTLAQNGNGNAAYIDTLNEARKVLVQEAGSTLFTIASDVKIQIEFNPAMVAEYRLIGYENRMLRQEDFNNDRVDAGEVGSGHTVTAIYEITPPESKARRLDPSRYQAAEGSAQSPNPNVNMPVEQFLEEYAFLKMRYKKPGEQTSTLMTRPIGKSDERANLAEVAPDMRFAAAVAAFGQLLRGGEFLGEFSYDEIITLAEPARGSDRYGDRAEFLNLVRLAKSLSPR